MNFKSWIEVLYGTVDVCNFVINEFNPSFEVQKMGKEAFQNALFGKASLPNGNKGNSCLCALSVGKIMILGGTLSKSDSKLDFMRISYPTFIVT